VIYVKKSTGWEKVSDWYDKIVGTEGHLYHKEVVLPNLLPLLKKSKSVLDCACGQGILARALDKNVEYLGLDLSPTLLNKAQSLSKQTFKKQDLCAPFSLNRKFDAAVCVLAFQNLEKPDIFLQNAAKHLKEGGELLLVMNHPCYRIPRQSGWGTDESKKAQFRKIERYMTPMEIPLQANPSKGSKSEIIRTFHHPLSAIVQMLSSSGFCITQMEEWCSHKMSEGRSARMENRARKEFPLFLTIVAKKGSLCAESSDT
jgi:ubiquinone/menaquinone biosynthesis C-methylase UbiE